MITAREREELNQLDCHYLELSNEADHFYVCPSCGQAVDCRRLGDVLHHSETEHEPLAVH